jgi:hypothetical protein
MFRLIASAILVASAAAQPQAPASPFAFQSNFWVNLHHFVRAVGRGMPAKATLTVDEQRTWDAAVALYRARYSNRDLLFDRGMVAINDALRRVPNDQTPAPIAAEPDLVPALISIARIYRKHWWAAHDTLNRAWIAGVQPLLARYGPELSWRVAAAYGESWPKTPHPVDVSFTAGPVGAYTSDHPPHTTIAAPDAGYAGPAALEILFHEASHQWGLRLQTALEASAKARNKTLPPQLWHAVLFYNAGELTRRVYAADGYSDYVEYAVKQDVYTRLCGTGCRERVAAAWNRRLDGSASIEEALDALVAGWPQ